MAAGAARICGDRTHLACGPLFVRGGAAASRSQIAVRAVLYFSGTVVLGIRVRADPVCGGAVQRQEARAEGEVGALASLFTSPARRRTRFWVSLSNVIWVRTNMMVWKISAYEILGYWTLN